MPKPPEGTAFRPYQDWGSGHEATVDEQGTYRLYHLAPGNTRSRLYMVRRHWRWDRAVALKTSSSVGSGVLFYPSNSQIQFFTIADGEEYKDVNFTLLPGAVGSVSGQVNAAGCSVRRGDNGCPRICPFRIEADGSGGGFKRAL